MTTDNFLKIKRRRTLVLDKNDTFLEIGDMISYKRLKYDEEKGHDVWVTLHGLIVEHGKKRISDDYQYRLMTILWDNGGIGELASDKLTLVQEGSAVRRSHPLPPLKPNNQKTRAQKRRIPKTVKRSRGRRR